MSSNKSYHVRSVKYYDTYYNLMYSWYLLISVDLIVCTIILICTFNLLHDVDYYLHINYHPADGSRRGRVFTSVYLCVCLLFCTTSQKPFILGSKSQRSRSRVTKTLPACVFAFLRVLAFSSYIEHTFKHKLLCVDVIIIPFWHKNWRV